MVLLVVSGAVGTTRYLMGVASFDLLSLGVNLFCIFFDLIILSVEISAATYTGPEPQQQKASVTA